MTKISKELINNELLRKGYSAIIQKATGKGQDKSVGTYQFIYTKSDDSKLCFPIKWPTRLNDLLMNEWIALFEKFLKAESPDGKLAHTVDLIKEKIKDNSQVAYDKCRNAAQRIVHNPGSVMQHTQDVFYNFRLRRNYMILERELSEASNTDVVQVIQNNIDRSINKTPVAPSEDVDESLVSQLQKDWECSVDTEFSEILLPFLSDLEAIEK